MVGQNSRGDRVLGDQKGVCGGLFVSREAALRFVRAGNGISIASGGHGFGKSRSGGPSGLSRRETYIDLQRRIA
jgi:hypothetical protein